MFLVLALPQETGGSSNGRSIYNFYFNIYGLEVVLFWCFWWCSDERARSIYIITGLNIKKWIMVRFWSNMHGKAFAVIWGQIMDFELSTLNTINTTHMFLIKYKDPRRLKYLICPKFGCITQYPSLCYLVYLITQFNRALSNLFQPLFWPKNSFRTKKVYQGLSKNTYKSCEGAAPKTKNLSKK